MELARLVERYYQLVDDGRLDEMLELFHPNVVYLRGGSPDIKGIDELRDFYLHSRSIQRGHHDLLTIVIEGDWAAVRGRFEGELRSGEIVSVDFADFHQFQDSLIIHRYTYFRDRAI